MENLFHNHLLENKGKKYYYDEEGNLTRKSTKEGEWEYAWNGNGSLKQVKRPDSKEVAFEYDALGRRTAKVFDGKITRWVWDGNTPLHEWKYELKDRPKEVVDEFGMLSKDREEPVENLVTWVFDEGSFKPAAKIEGDKTYSIITDYLGTPQEAYDQKGEKVWECEYEAYGKVKSCKGEQGFVPFRFQGQYEDVETGLYYNRFRYYAAEEGMYVSQDPIGLRGGSKFYNYVIDTNTWVDVLGLNGIVPSNLVAFGNKTTPRLPRAGKDIDVDPGGNVRSQEGVKFPQGASTFQKPSQAPLTGHYHDIAQGTILPEGLGVKADGRDIFPDSPHGVGHHTIYPTVDMSFEEFQNKFSEIDTSYGGKKC